MQNETNNILEILISNPIGYNEIEHVKSQILNTENYSFLIIDTGRHDFVSIDIMKYLKDQLQQLESQLKKFKKIALIHPPKYWNESSNPEMYEYFTSIVEAKKWFLK